MCWMNIKVLICSYHWQNVFLLLATTHCVSAMSSRLPSSAYRLRGHKVRRDLRQRLLVGHDSLVWLGLKQIWNLTFIRETISSAVKVTSRIRQPELTDEGRVWQTSSLIPSSANCS